MISILLSLIICHFLKVQLKLLQQTAGQFVEMENNFNVRNYNVSAEIIILNFKLNLWSFVARQVLRTRDWLFLISCVSHNNISRIWRMVVLLFDGG